MGYHGRTRLATIVLRRNRICTAPKKVRALLVNLSPAYLEKNRGSPMLLNPRRCPSLTPDDINTASALDLHQVRCFTRDHAIVTIDAGRASLSDVLNRAIAPDSLLLRWLFGCPSSREQRVLGVPLATEWFAVCGQDTRLWD